MDKALALFVDMDLSYRQYNMMRTTVNTAHKDCFPSYYALQMAKKKYIPESIIVSETSVQVPLQGLLNLTVRSYLNIYNFESKNLIFEVKWGFDGSSGHSVYKQKFSDPNAHDEFLFIASFVPIRIVDKSTDKVLWNNFKHSSPNYCRPFRFYLQKENTNLIKSTESSIKSEIDNLEPFTFVSINRWSCC